jgi:hypothetical protein
MESRLRLRNDGSMKTLNGIITTSLSVAALLILANCGNNETFSKASTNAVASSGPTSDPTLPNAPLTETPEITLAGSNCFGGNPCVMTATLNEKLSDELSAQWATDNTIYETTPPTGVVYSIPNVDYVPTSGQITFAAGALQTSVIVDTLYDPNASPNVTRSIVVNFSGCLYGGTQYNCASLGL